MNLKDAKDHFIESGRLNRNVVRDDISISWYKCRLSQLSIDHDGTICQNNKKIKTINKFDPSFIDYLDSIIPVSYDFVIADENHNVIYRRTENQTIENIQCIEEHCIGTNAGALVLKSGIEQIVMKHEHYLNSWSELYSYGIPIREEEDLIGAIMLIASFQPTEFDINAIKEKLRQFEKRRTKTVETEMKELHFEDYFTYPEKYKEIFIQSLSRLSVINTPVMIMGGKGSGKTTLAWFLSYSNGLSPYLVNGSNIPKIMESEIIKKALYQYETVVIECFESLSPENKQLLTAYTEEKIISKTSEKYSNYKAQNIILTTDYTSEDQCDKIDLKLMNRYSVNTVKLKNLDVFRDDYREIVKKIMERYELRISDDVISVIAKSRDINTFKDLSGFVEEVKEKNKDKSYIDVSDLIYKKEPDIHSLEEQEKKYVSYVYERMDNNISATAEVLKIGRSTLYRKLEKYQIDTTERKPK
jgi:Holliday junction resolvasome RuvABC ATP-dependent DNA helicase subunit